MEVFIFFSADNDLHLVEHTLEAWEKQVWAEPINVIQLPKHKFELKRRVLADKMAIDQHYILADLGCIFEDERAIPALVQRLRSTDGLLLLGSQSETSIRVCRKGCVTKWPTPRTERYDEEHAQAVRTSNYEVRICQDITSKQLPVS